MFQDEKKVKNIKLCRIKIEKVKGLRNGKVKFETEVGGVRLCQALELITFFFLSGKKAEWMKRRKYHLLKWNASRNHVKNPLACENFMNNSAQTMFKWKFPSSFSCKTINYWHTIVFSTKLSSNRRSFFFYFHHENHMLRIVS